MIVNIIIIIIIIVSLGPPCERLWTHTGQSGQPGQSTSSTTLDLGNFVMCLQIAFHPRCGQGAWLDALNGSGDVKYV